MTSSAHSRSGSAGLNVLSAVALKAAMTELVGIFEKEAEATVKIDFDFNPAVARRIECDERFDIAVTNPHLIDRLVEHGLLDSATRVTIGSSPLGLAVHRRHAGIDVSNVAAFKNAMMSAATIGYAPEGTSGRRLISILRGLGLADVVRSKLRPMLGGHAGYAVAAGEVECSIVPISTILVAAPDTVLAGVLPAELDIDIIFEAAIAPQALANPLATRLSSLLMAPRVDDLIRAKGITRLRAPA
jgi:molybdate transport system substrate-binding protein